MNSTDDNRSRKPFAEGLAAAKLRSHARMEKAIAWAIRSAAILTMMALIMIIVSLIQNVVPIFRSPKLQNRATIELPDAVGEWVHIGFNDAASYYWLINHHGVFHVVSSESGELIHSLTCDGLVKEGRTISCVCESEDGRSVLLGMDDGELWWIGIDHRIVTLSDAEASLLPQPVVESQTLNGSLYERREEGKIRRSWVERLHCLGRWQLPEKPHQIDFVLCESDGVAWEETQLQIRWGASTESGLCWNRWTSPKKSERDIASEAIDSQSVNRHPWEGHFPIGLMLEPNGNGIHVATRQGNLLHCSLDLFDPPQTENNIPFWRTSYRSGHDASWRSLVPMAGRRSLLLTGSDGLVEGLAPSGMVHEGTREWVRTTYVPPQSTIPQMVLSNQAHPDYAVVDVLSQGTLYHPRLNAARWRSSWELQGGITFGRFVSKGTRMLIGNQREIGCLEWDRAYPESQWESLFSQQWYAGYTMPKWIWQSSVSSSSEEPKLSLVPLLAGTVKGGLVAMLISLPLALGAAIYTSEYMPSKQRQWVKPLVELMASIPSVVLGCIAVFVLGAWLGSSLGAVLLFLGLAPFGWMLCAYLAIHWRWNDHPHASWMRIACMALLWVVFAWIAFRFQSTFENIFLGAPLIQWIATGKGHAWGAWCFVSFLVLISTFAVTRLVSPFIMPSRWREFLQSQSHRIPHGLGYSLGFTLCAVGLLTWIAYSGLGDIRDYLSDSYQDRNALIVGIVLGFATIPIIYTLAEDALNQVPLHLRAASLASGASVWQTLVRVVWPSASGGVTCAVLIGFGRALGETMIMVMVTGNMAVVDWSPFIGFQTIAGTLFTELPEASVGSPHYHVLFLAAFLLFLMTLLVNSLAEFVRGRIRREVSRL